LGLRPALHLKPPQRLAISFGASPRLAFKKPQYYHNALIYHYNNALVYHYNNTLVYHYNNALVYHYNNTLVYLQLYSQRMQGHKFYLLMPLLACIVLLFIITFKKFVIHKVAKKQIKCHKGDKQSNVILI